MTRTNRKPNPMVTAAQKRLQLRMSRRARSYGLGERNPDTLPGSGRDAESIFENDQRTAFWQSLRKKVAANSRVERHLP